MYMGKGYTRGVPAGSTIYVILNQSIPYRQGGRPNPRFCGAGGFISSSLDDDEVVVNVGADLQAGMKTIMRCIFRDGMKKCQEFSPTFFELLLTLD
jgi:hypothetical protein